MGLAHDDITHWGLGIKVMVTKGVDGRKQYEARLRRFHEVYFRSEEKQGPCIRRALRKGCKGELSAGEVPKKEMLRPQVGAGAQWREMKLGRLCVSMAPWFSGCQQRSKH